MKKLIVINLILLCCFTSFGQKLNLGVDIGYQIGKHQYFEPGLNLTMISKNGNYGVAVAFGLLDNIQTTDLGYKLGLIGYNLKNESIPLLVGLSAIKHNVQNKKFTTFTPEVGLVKKYYHFGKGLSYISVSYGYNFTNKKFKNDINKHFIRTSINTNIKGFIEFLGFLGYKAVSVFHPNWS